MRWFQKRRARRAAQENVNQAAEVTEKFTDIARELMKGFVDATGLDGNQFGVPDNLRRQFSAKARIYNESIILALLTSKAQQDSSYKNLLIAFERLVFPGTQAESGVAKLSQVNEAVRNVAELLRSKESEMRWARSWLSSIGREETNPVTLGLFAWYWMERYKAISLAIGDIRALLT